eukprot:gene3857-4120_t
MSRQLSDLKDIPDLKLDSKPVDVSRGSGGEYYYIPGGRPILPSYSGFQRVFTLSILPRTQVLFPGIEERFSIPEMRYKRFINEMEENEKLFGSTYYTVGYNNPGKMGLAGTITKVKKVERLEDGAMFVTVEGIGRYWIDDLFTDTPYYRGHVRHIYDITEEDPNLDTLDYPVLNRLTTNILQELRITMTYASLLLPDKPYLLSEKFLKSLPPIFYQLSNERNSNRKTSKKSQKTLFRPTRTVTIPDYDIDSFMLKGVSFGEREGYPHVLTKARRGEYFDSEVEKLTKFSFHVLSLLKIDLTTKLKCLQIFHIERRLLKISEILKNTIAFSEGELLRKNLLTKAQIEELKLELVDDCFNWQSWANFSNTSKLQKWLPENYIDGDWKMRPALMD